ncbi:MAG TPA: PIF1 family DEAD/DEAH box helicase, partial [Patescibacteria group bacterium]|nr:PIF1 family DEAD/DEAH box helicase [Patescibacteria group bacterium]
MQQDRALEYLQEGRNVFLTGPAGSGKTYVLTKFIDWLKKQGKTVAITASTGIAATHLGGTTIHSWTGIGIKDFLTPFDLDELTQKEHLYRRFRTTDVLIIDEISMLHSFRLDMVDTVLRTVCENEQPFGGIQVVLAGDFFQLPPINRYSTDTNYAFEAQVWERTNMVVCYLETVYRQSNDPLLQILQEVRQGKVSEKSMELLQKRTQIELPDHITPTRLYTHNIDVDAVNKKELAKISKKAEVFSMTTVGKKNDVQLLQKYCLAPEVLELKVGAQVMFVKNNFSAGFVNGTLGTVVSFAFGKPMVKTVEGKRIIVELEAWMMEQSGKIKAEIRQLPLRLAWAITVHKSQGMTLDVVDVDLSKS